MDANRHVVVGVEVVPLCADPYPIVDRAIAAIQATGVRSQVCPLETVMEGTLEECLAAVRAAHHAALEAGAPRVITYVKISDGANGSSIDELMAKYR
ncbi:MAG: thiamine-binding protein [Anaerolineae bacterium]|nr:thiamine-binding protein [Anaerolineae bacterium]MDW8299570.1 thiamine-binding protein [Anaerolineae bacterium]